MKIYLPINLSVQQRYIKLQTQLLGGQAIELGQPTVLPQSICVSVYIPIYLSIYLHIYLSRYNSSSYRSPYSSGTPSYRAGSTYSSSIIYLCIYISICFFLIIFSSINLSNLFTCKEIYRIDVEQMKQRKQHPSR